MKETDQLEPQQYQRLYWDADVPLKDLRMRLIKRMLGVALILFACIVIFSSILKFPDQIELPFTLKDDIQEEVIRLPHKVYLMEQYVRSDDSVSSGTPLLRITSPEIVHLINRFREARDALVNLNGSKRKAEESHRQIILTSIRQNQNLMDDFRVQWDMDRKQWMELRKKYQAELSETDARLNAIKNLRSHMIGSRFDSVAQETKFVQLTTALNQDGLKFEKESIRIQNILIRLEADNELNLSKLKKSIFEFHADSAELFTQKELAWLKLTETYGFCEILNGGIVLKSPAAGHVSFLFEGEKEIPEGANLIKIRGHSHPTYGFVKCPPAIAGKIRKNQNCHLKVFSFPFYEYGTVKGYLRSISHSPDENGDYNVQIAISDPGRLVDLLHPGLTGHAVIIMEEKTLLQYFFNKVKKHQHKLWEGEGL